MSLALLGLLAFSAVEARADKAEGAALVAAAEEADRALRNDERRLRFRHHILRVVKQWAAAKAAATGAARVRAAEGEAEAWALLAHWSGRGDDLRQARALKEALAAPPPAPKAPKAQIEKPEELEEKKKKYWLASVRIERDDERVAVTFDADGKPTFERGVLPHDGKGPVRVYFDVTPAVASKAALGAFEVEGARVSSARVAQFDDDTARVVFDVAVEDLDELVVDGDRIVLPTAPAPAPALAEVDEEEESDDPRAELKRLEVALRALTDDRTKDDLLSEIVEDVRTSYPDVDEPKAEIAAPVAKPVVAKVVPPKGPLKRSTRDAARPRASSLVAVRRIVIDPGHGGKDHGATGPGRVREKDVNLAISKRLAKSLRKRLGVEVVLTRSKDQFISLRRRTQIANKSGADLFISVHANANRNKGVHGIETYHLNVTSNRYSKRLARRENLLERGAGDVPEPEDQEDEPIEELIPDGKAGQDLRLILADLAMRSATVESRRLAGYVQSSLVGTLRRDHEDVRDLGVKHALFYVLLGARMPAVLIETGFVSNEMESKRLSSAKYQEQVADSIASGVERFVAERQRLAQGGVASL